MDAPSFRDLVTTEEELRSVLGHPSELGLKKRIQTGHRTQLY